jgi:hypothetical protein
MFHFTHVTTPSPPNFLRYARLIGAEYYRAQRLLAIPGAFVPTAGLGAHESRAVYSQ